MFPNQQQGAKQGIKSKYQPGSGSGPYGLGQQYPTMGSQLRQPGGQGMGQQMRPTGMGQGMGTQRPRYQTNLGTPSASGFQGGFPSPPQGGGSPWGSMQQMGGAADQSGMRSGPSAVAFNGSPQQASVTPPPPPPQPQMASMSMPLNPSQGMQATAPAPAPPPSLQATYMPSSPSIGATSAPSAQGYMGGFANPAMGTPDQFSTAQAQKRLNDLGTPQQGQQTGGFGRATMGFQGF